MNNVGWYKKSHQVVRFFCGRLFFGSFDFAQDDQTLRLGRFLDSGVEAGLFPRGGVFLDDTFGGGFVDGLLRPQVGFFHTGGVARGNGCTGILHRALHDTLHDFVAERLSLGDAHVLSGIFLDWHSCKIKI